MKSRPPLLFLHLPKTAGMTVRSVLASRYRKTRSLVIGNDINADIARLVALPPEQRHRLDLVMGHMSFGLHQALRPGARYVTVLRDPVDRVLSEYRFLNSNPRHPFHHAVAGRSLEEYLASDYSGQSSDGQVRLLSGNHEPGRIGIAGRDPLGQEDLAAALRHLDGHFLVAGTQSLFEETLLLLARRLGWRLPPLYMARNVTAAAPRIFTADQRELVASHNRLDIALYREVERRLRREIDAEGPGIQRALARFRRWNPLYRRWLSRYMQYRQRLARRHG